MKFIRQINFVICVIAILVVMTVSCSETGSTDKHVKSDSVKSGQKKKLYTGIRETKDASGRLSASVEYKDGKRDGAAYNYYTNGNVKLKVEYKEGAKHGEYRWYFQDGQVYKEATYADDELNGMVRYYRDDGSIKYEMPYKNGKEGVGFVEYATSGEPKSYLKDLDITIRMDNNVRVNNSFSMYMGLTDYSIVDEVYFYLGELDEGKYLHDALEELYTDDTYAEIHQKVDPGYAVTETVNVVAEIITKDDKTIVLQKPYKIDVQNR